MNDLVTRLRAVPNADAEAAADAIEKLRKERDEMLAALRNVLPLLDKAFDYDANVFGILHNDAVDVEADIRRITDADRAEGDA